jgi:hypothetical protein
MVLFLDDFIAVFFVGFAVGDSNQINSLRILAYIKRGYGIDNARVDLSAV